MDKYFDLTLARCQWNNRMHAINSQHRLHPMTRKCSLPVDVKGGRKTLLCKGYTDIQDSVMDWTVGEESV